MKSAQILSTVTALAVLLTASPVPQSEADELLHLRAPPASACYPAAAPRCCVPTHCQCSDGHIYLFNTANQQAGGNGCDPPWAFIGKSMREFPGYCCR